MKPLRDDAERLYFGRVDRLVDAGVVQASRLGDYGIRLEANGRVADYWPRTGTWRSPSGAYRGEGWNSLLRALKIRDKAWRVEHQGAP